MNERPHESWRREFKDLGAAGVRRELLQRRWPPEKLSAARHWLQFQDIQEWQQRTPIKRERFRPNYKRLAQYLVAAVLVLFAAARLVRMMRHGF